MNPKQQDRAWLQSVQKNCEAVGISRLIIERFESYYLVERKGQNERTNSTIKRA